MADGLLDKELVHFWISLLGSTVSRFERVLRIIGNRFLVNRHCFMSLDSKCLLMVNVP